MSRSRDFCQLEGRDLRRKGVKPFNQPGTTLAPFALESQVEIVVGARHSNMADMQEFIQRGRVSIEIIHATVNDIENLFWRSTPRSAPI